MKKRLALSITVTAALLIAANAHADQCDALQTIVNPGREPLHIGQNAYPVEATVGRSCVITLAVPEDDKRALSLRTADGKAIAFTEQERTPIKQERAYGCGEGHYTYETVGWRVVQLIPSEPLPALSKVEVRIGEATLATLDTTDKIDAEGCDGRLSVFPGAQPCSPGFSSCQAVRGGGSGGTAGGGTAGTGAGGDANDAAGCAVGASGSSAPLASLLLLLAGALLLRRRRARQR